jgi:hypothetical protein
MVLPTGKPITIGFRVRGLAAGTLQFAFGIGLDGAAPHYVPTNSPAILVAPKATTWTGQACLTPTMQAQIPAATQPTYWVCPPSS